MINFFKDPLEETYGPILLANDSITAMWYRNRKMLLTSTGFKNKKLKSYLEQILPAPINKCKVSLLTFDITSEKILKNFYAGMKDLVGVGFKKENIKPEDFKTVPDFSMYDVIYVIGDKDETLLKLINNSGIRGDLKKAITKGTVYIGVSAGSNIVGYGGFSGLYLSSLTQKVITHCNDEHNEDGKIDNLFTSTSMIGKSERDRDIRLADNQALLVLGSKLYVVS